MLSLYSNLQLRQMLTRIPYATFTIRLSSKSVLKSSLKISSQLKRAATLSYEISGALLTQQTMAPSFVHYPVLVIAGMEKQNRNITQAMPPYQVPKSVGAKK